MTFGKPKSFWTKRWITLQYLSFCWDKLGGCLKFLRRFWVAAAPRVTVNEIRLIVRKIRKIKIFLLQSYNHISFTFLLFISNLPIPWCSYQWYSYKTPSFSKHQRHASSNKNTGLKFASLLSIRPHIHTIQGSA